MPATNPEVSDNPYQWTVQGMDCPSCAGKIRGAVERLKGVSDVQVSVTCHRTFIQRLLESDQFSCQWARL